MDINEKNNKIITNDEAEDLELKLIQSETTDVEEHLADENITEEIHHSKSYKKHKRQMDKIHKKEHDVEDMADKVRNVKKSNPKNAMFQGTRWEHSGAITKFWHRHVIFCSIILSMLMLTMGIMVGVGSTMATIQQTIQDTIGTQQVNNQTQTPSWQSYYLSADLQDVDFDNGLIKLTDGRTIQVQPGWTITEVEEQVPAFVIQNEDGENIVCMVVDCDDLSTFQDLELIQSDDGTNTVISAFNDDESGSPVENVESYIKYMGVQ